ncbi:MAG: LysM peptidoglycan-binding domain-containing protein [Chloroflexi bacterium]|nr:LysM peptidoglycan-binding domain-containing protein [Chloroflexota bacterium]
MAAPGATPNTSASGAFLAYTVQPGDTLHTIASTYGVSSAVIAKASGLQNVNQLKVGQVLTVPKQPGWLYRVQDGETLDQIAARNNLSSDAIASASGLTAASVQPGDVLLIPDPSQAVAATAK